MIEYLPREVLDEAILREYVFPRLDRTHYWSDLWDPAFYVAVARAGFICICIEHPELGHVLIPELQTSYAVLDWENLHASRNLRRIIGSGRLEEEQIELRVANPCEQVLARVVEYHGQSNWLHEPYLNLMRTLADDSAGDFALHGIELWSRQSDELIAGELGYTIGTTYTSLSGFCLPTERNWRSYGTLQQFLLAESLAERGYEFWNMGHVGMPYKLALGAKELTRGEFLDRWLVARDDAPAAEMRNGDMLKSSRTS